MAFHGMGFSYRIVVYNYNSKFKKPIIKLHCDKNLAWFLMLYFILKNGIRNSKRVQLWCPDRQKRSFFIAAISEKRSLILPILVKNGGFRSLIIVSMLLVKLKSCIAGVVREQIWCQIWIQHVEKPPCASFWSNRGNQWRLTAYCKFRLMTCASDFERQPLL